MYDFVIYLKGTETTIEGTVKKADKLRELMATRSGDAVEIPDNTGFTLVRPCDVLAVACEDAKATAKAGFAQD